MTHRNAYKMISEDGTIDRILSDATRRGENFLIAKKYIADGIDYYCDFTKSISFREMKYWQDKHLDTEDQKSRRLVVNAVCTALAHKEAEGNEKRAEMLNYFISTMA